MRDIVEPVGMLPGSLYYHFATKEELLVAVYARRRRAHRRRGATPRSRAIASRGSGSRQRASPISNALLDQTDYAQVVIRVRPSDAPAAAAELIALRDEYEKRFARAGRRAAAGRARPTARRCA